MKLSQFKFKLPEDKIALHPTKYRDESRLMVLHRNTGKIEHRMFKDVLDYFDDKDVFIFNDTKVFPARLYGNKEKTGARIEVFLLRELNEEAGVSGKIVRPLAIEYKPDLESRIFTFLVEIPDDAVPHKGIDPELSESEQTIVGVTWRTLEEIAERDRAYLFGAGLMRVPLFHDEVLKWPDDAIRYPE